MYVNPGLNNFVISRSSEIYVDKTALLAFTNSRIHTQQRYICISRPRRFDKSMAADMLNAYYNFKCDADKLFDGLKIKNDGTYPLHLNKYNVIKIDMQYFMTREKSIEAMLQLLIRNITDDLRDEFPDLYLRNEQELPVVLNAVYAYTKRPFVILIDEWDCVMRRAHDSSAMKLYLDFLRNLVKDQPYIALAYMTGILPIKKYGEHSTLNMFDEYSMLSSKPISDCFGFTEDEVRQLCNKYNMSFAEAKNWYDGYKFAERTRGIVKHISIYSPKSVVDAMLKEDFDSYWTQTETFESLKIFIERNYDGLRDAVVEMLAGNAVKINTRHFQNDMMTFNGKDDVLTLLVHLGYLSYNAENSSVAIPNKEVAQEFVNTIEMIPAYSEVYKAVDLSHELLQSLWKLDADAVAKGIESAHEHFSSLKYNDENSLSCAIELAFYYAREYYTVIREMPTGKGFADICYIPKQQHLDKPALIVELKWDKDAESALNQIKKKCYPAILEEYKDNLLLCGINYDKQSRKHTCIVEQYHK